MRPHFPVIYLTISILGSSTIFGFSLKYTLRFVPSNCIKAAKWCCANKLYQQATTLLEEGLGTFLCCHYQLDYRNKANRDAVFSCISIKTQSKDSAGYETNKELVDNILADESVWGNKAFVTILQKIVELRNDYNHAGFKENPFSAQTIIERVELLLDGIEEVLSQI